MRIWGHTKVRAVPFPLLAITALAVASVPGSVPRPSDPLFPAPITPVPRGPWRFAHGDFNADGRPDLAAAGSSFSFQAYALINTPSGTFTVNRLSGFTGEAYGVAVADFNDDGRQDISTANGPSDDVAIYLGGGDGTFGNGIRVRTGRYPVALASGDYDGDGLDDLAVANSSDREIVVLRSTAAGTFEVGTRIVLESFPNAVAALDLNRDSSLDLVVLLPGLRAIYAFLGDGAGSFGLTSTSGVGQFGIALDFADLNGDGPIDAVVANRDSNDVSILLGRGDGTFDPEQRFEMGARPMSVDSGDLNQDGIVDLAVANWESNDVTVRIGNGDGTFGEIRRFGFSDIPWAVTIADFTLDGIPDLVVGNVDLGYASLWIGRGDGDFVLPLIRQVGRGPLPVVTADFNGDSRPDVATANVGSNDLSILLGAADATLTTERRFPVGMGPWAMVSADFNHDNLPDLATVNRDSDTVSVLLSDGSGEFVRKPDIDLGAPFAFLGSTLTSGDFNGDGWIDLALNDYPEISLLLGRGDGTFQQVSAFRPTHGYSDIAAGDFNGDRLSDLAVIQPTSPTGQERGRIWMYLGTGDGRFEVHGSFSAGVGPSDLEVEDLNFDGRLDLAVANAQSHSVSILLGTGDGGFRVQREFPAGHGPLSLAAGDLDSDGIIDLAAACVGRAFSYDITGEVTVLIGRGDGTFSPGGRFGAGGEPWVLAAADFDLDRRTDLAVTSNGDDLVFILFNQGPPPFTQVAIDVRPGSDSNPIRVDSGGALPVAILGSESFDPEVVRTATITLAGASVMPNRSGENDLACRTEDSNGDGRMDLLCHFEISKLTFEAEEPTLELRAETLDGGRIRGRDTIRIVPGGRLAAKPPAVHVLNSPEPTLRDSCNDSVLLYGRVLDSNDKPIPHLEVIPDFLLAFPESLKGAFSPTPARTDASGSYAIEFRLDPGSCLANCTGASTCFMAVSATAGGLASNVVLIDEAIQ